MEEKYTEKKEEGNILKEIAEKYLILNIVYDLVELLNQKITNKVKVIISMLIVLLYVYYHPTALGTVIKGLLLTGFIMFVYDNNYHTKLLHRLKRNPKEEFFKDLENKSTEQLISFINGAYLTDREIMKVLNSRHKKSHEVLLALMNRNKKIISEIIDAIAKDQKTIKSLKTIPQNVLIDILLKLKTKISKNSFNKLKDMFAIDKKIIATIVIINPEYTEEMNVKNRELLSSCNKIHKFLYIEPLWFLGILMVIISTLLGIFVISVHFPNEEGLEIPYFFIVLSISWVILVLTRKIVTPIMTTIITKHVMNLSNGFNKVQNSVKIANKSIEIKSIK